MNYAMKIICNNKKAYHNFFISENTEAGIELVGSEVKSVKAGGVSIADAFVFCKNNEMFVRNMYIKPYEKTASYAPDTLRDRKLLLHREQIDKFAKKVKLKGFSIMPTKVYLSNGRVKIEIALSRGKKLFDKRNALMEQTEKRNLERELKNR